MLDEDEVVVKVLRSLAPKFNFAAMVIEESKHISTFSLNELSRSLQAHKVKVNRVVLKVGERALHVMSEVKSSKISQGGGSSHGNSC